MTLSEKLVVIRLSFIKYAFALLAEYHERSTAPNSACLLICRPCQNPS